MEKLKPMLWSVMKGYTKEQLVKDIVAGIIVAIIALPLSIALALASGVTPERGIYTAITAGFVISFLGGSRVQIAGPTAAFATIVAGIAAENGIEGLALATVMAGIILIIMGVCRMGSLIKYIPYTITTGFTAGIAVTIFIGQIKDFLGLTVVSEEPLIETMDKLVGDIRFISTINVQAVIVGAVCLAILIVWPMINETIPPSLLAVIAGIAMVKGLHMPVNTIGDLYTISNALPALTVPVFNFDMVQKLLPDAFTIAILAAIESLLSCVVAAFQYRTGSPGRGQYRFCIIWRYPCHRCHCPYSSQYQEWRTYTDCRYGSCGCTSVDSCCADALCGTDSDADDCSDFVYGSL